MSSETTVLFREVSGAFGRHPTAIDHQTDTMDILQLVLSITGEKAVFMGVTGDVLRAAPYKDAIEIAKRYGLSTGAGKVNVHRRCRSLQIADERIGREVECRSRTPMDVYWATRRADLHDLFDAGDTTSLPDTELLGYPECCVSWHYDCYFARGIEAFADVYVAQTSVDTALSVLRNGWYPASGWFLPRTYYLAAILVSNRAYPFIDHIACPECIRRPSGASGEINRQNSETILACDPERHEKVLRYAGSLKTRIAAMTRRPADAIDEEIGDFAWTVRASESYIRRSRYLFRSLGLADCNR